MRKEGQDSRIPQYIWQDKKSKKEVTVIRSFSEYENPPTQEEAPDLIDPEWERLIGSNQILQRGPNWGGAKGYWAIFLIFLPYLIRGY